MDPNIIYVPHRVYVLGSLLHFLLNKDYAALDNLIIITTYSLVGHTLCL
jgi:hypothetical protein